MDTPMRENPKPDIGWTYDAQWDATVDRLNRDPASDEVRRKLRHAIAIALWHVADHVGNELAEERRGDPGLLWEAVATWPTIVAQEMYPELFRALDEPGSMDADALEELVGILQDELADMRELEAAVWAPSTWGRSAKVELP
jgi:hypothetical protein